MASENCRKILIIGRLLGYKGNSRREKVKCELQIMKEKGFSIDVVTIDEGHDELFRDYKSHLKGVVDRWYPFVDPLRYMGKKIKKLLSKDNIRNSLRFESTKNPLNFFVSFPDPSLFWMLWNRTKILKIIKKNMYSHVYTLSLPNSTHLLGYQIKKKIPSILWYMSYRDPWSNNPLLYEKNKCVWKINVLMERKCLSLCNKVIIYKGWIPDGKKYFQRLHGNIIEKKVYESPYIGCNEERIDNVPKSYKGKKNNGECLKIVYLGRFYGSDYSPDTFLKALRELLSEDPLNIHVDFIGDMTKSSHKMIQNDSVLREKVRVFGYRKFDWAISMLMDADVALWIIGSKKGTPDNVPSKVFEYVYLGIPILSLIPSNSHYDLTKKYNLGISATNNNIDQIKNSLRKLYELKKEKKLSQFSNPELFSRRKFRNWFRSIINTHNQ